MERINKMKMPTFGKKFWYYFWCIASLGYLYAIQVAIEKALNNKK